MRLVCDGHSLFRQRIVLSLLSSKPLRIQNIRPDCDVPGVSPAEVCFLKLVQQISNGSVVKISHSGCTVDFIPGVIAGGEFVFETSARGLSYFIEPAVLLGLYAKLPLILTLSGTTSCALDSDIDTLRTVLLPFLARLGASVALQVNRRGAPPLGGGECLLTVHPSAIDMALLPLSPGLVKRIRGIAKSTRVSPSIVNRLVKASRGLLTRFLPDVYVYTDVSKAPSAGFALSLVAETTTGVLYYAECAASPRIENESELTRNPDHLGDLCARALVDKIAAMGCVDFVNEWPALVLSAKGGTLARILLPNRNGLHESTVQYLKLIEKFLNIRFKITAQENGVLLTCVGTTFFNVNRKVD